MFTLQFGSYTFPNQSFIVDGFPLEKNIQENLIPRRDGAVIPTSYLKARTFKITGKVYQADADTGLTDLLALQAALLSGEKEFYYRADRYIKAYVSAIMPTYPKGVNYNVVDLEIDMAAQDPYFYAAGASIQDVFNLVGGTTAFNVNNNGNVFSEAKIYLYASGLTLSDNMRLTNSSDNSTYFRYRGVLPFGLTLSLDSTQFEFKVNGVDGLSNFEGNFLNLVAGSNLFSYVGGTVRITVEHKNRWYN